MHATGMQGLVLMVLDVVEEAGGRFNLWGVTPSRASVLIRVPDFQPYFYMAAPIPAVSQLPTTIQFVLQTQVIFLPEESVCRGPRPCSSIRLHLHWCALAQLRIGISCNAIQG